MGKRLFVGNLAYGTTEESLREIFEQSGASVTDARIVRDRETGNSRGFGFVEYATEEAAQAAVEEFDGALLEGRPMRVNVAQDRADVGERRGPPPARPRGDGPPGRPPFRERGPGEGFAPRPPREGAFRGPPREEETGADAPPRRRERRPKPPGQDQKRKEGSGRRPHPDAGRRQAPRYRNVDDWEDDEGIY